MSPDEAEFRTLVERARLGDGEAAEILYSRYSAYIRVAVRRRLHPRLRRQFDSLDFVQDVWASFLAGPTNRQFETPQALVVFLTRVARNKVIEEVRRRFTTAKADITREQSLDASAAKVPARDPSPSQCAIADEQWDRLTRQFPVPYRAILERLRSGYTYEDIAQQSGVSLSTVNRIVRRIKALGDK